VNLSSEIILSESKELTTLSESKRDLYLEFLVNYPSQNTRDAYYRDLREFNQFLSDFTSITDDIYIDTKTVIAFRESLLKKGISKRTINRKLAALYSYYQFLFEKDAIGSNPVGRTKKYKVSNEIKSSYLDDKYVQEYFLLPVNPHKGSELLERAVLRTFFIFGPRSKSVRSLRYKNLVMADGKYAFNFTIKGGSEIIREIPNILKNELGDYMSWCQQKGWSTDPDDFIFRGTRNYSKDPEKRLLSNKAVNDMVRKMTKKVGAKGDFSSHSARVGVISKLESLVGIYGAKDYVAHKSVITTEAYRNKGPSSSSKLGHKIM
jgi:site-specific recombinase XerD